MEPGGEPFARVLSLLKAYGWNSTSFQVFEPGFRYWFAGSDACIAYVDTGRAWVVAGSPIAPRARFPEVTSSFLDDARAAGRRVAFFGTEARFHETMRWPAIRIGDQPIWAPADWGATLARSRSLREQLRRARAKGITVRTLDPSELEAAHATRARLDALIGRWLAAKPMATMGFLVQVHPYTFPRERRSFAAEQGGRIVGFLGIVPVYARGGWFFEDFLSDPDAPNGTIETLIDAGMRSAAAEGVAYVTLGLAPLVGNVGRWLRVFRRWGGGFYDFAGLHAFKAKFRPRAWDPIYLSFPPGSSGLAAIFDTLSAFARGGLVAFGARTLLRAPAIVTRLLSVLLIPWILVLSIPASAPWFPSDVWRWGWVGFDVAVCAGLFVLSRRWRPRLAHALALAVTLDAVLTLLQAIAFDLPRHSTPLERSVIAIAVLAPIAAATVLWSGRAHRRLKGAEDEAPPL